MTFKVTSLSVITQTMGTLDLFKSWESYVNGLYFLFQSRSAVAAKWYDIDSNPGGWEMPGMCPTYYKVIFEDESIVVKSNYSPTTTVAIGSEAGYFNSMKDFLAFNTFTNKRVAFNPTIFIRDPTSLLYYACGKLPFAYINGTNLSFGQTVNFGSDVYKCYPGINMPNPIWVAYRTS